MAEKLSYHRVDDGLYQVTDAHRNDLGEILKEPPSEWWCFPEPDVRIGPFPRRRDAGKALLFTHLATQDIVEVVEPGHLLADPLPVP